MSQPFPPSPFLEGNYAPWRMEGEVLDATVEGELPESLHGTLYRNGPNPQHPPRGRYHWFDGDGMIHAFHFEGGRVRYRNRWVRTERWRAERAAGQALFSGLASTDEPGPGAAGVSGNTANTHVVWHAGRLLALWEAGLPHELDPDTLETLGTRDFGGALQGPMTAHPKLDPETGELLLFGYRPAPPFFTYHVVSAAGALTRSVEIDVPYASMVHDFIATREHVVIPIFPAALRPENAELGRPLIGWAPELGTHIGVMPRDGGNDDVVWFQADPCYVFHPLNARTLGRSVVAEVARYPRLPLFGPEESRSGLEREAPATLVRWTLDLDGGTLKEESLDDAPIEFPRLDERFAGLPYRHGYAAGRLGAPNPGGPFDAVLHYDVETGSRRAHRLPAGSYVGEPIFVPRTPSAPEGDGLLLALVYREAERRSDLLVLDATSLGDPPLATVRLPHRVPYGFHGSWRPAPL